MVSPLDAILSQLEKVNIGLMDSSNAITSAVKTLKEAVAQPPTEPSTDLSPLLSKITSLEEKIASLSAPDEPSSSAVTKLESTVSSVLDAIKNLNDISTSVSKELAELKENQARTDISLKLIRSNAMAASEPGNWTSVFTSKPITKYSAQTKASVDTAVFFSRSDSISDSIKEQRQVRVSFGETRESAVQVAMAKYDAKLPTIIRISTVFDLGASNVVPSANTKFFVDVLVSDVSDVMEIIGFNAVSQ